jgi:hypothetical protein
VRGVLLGDAGPAALLAEVVVGHGRLIERGEDRGEGGDEDGAPLQGQIAQFVGHSVAVLDAGDTGLEGVADARGALGVCGDRLPAMPSGLVDDGLQFVGGQPLVVGVVVRAAHAAGGTHLDHVGPRPEHLAGGEPHPVGGVRDLGQPRCGVDTARQ